MYARSALLTDNETPLFPKTLQNVVCRVKKAAHLLANNNNKSEPFFGVETNDCGDQPFTWFIDNDVYIAGTGWETKQTRSLQQKRTKWRSRSNRCNFDQLGAKINTDNGPIYCCCCQAAQKQDTQLHFFFSQVREKMCGVIWLAIEMCVFHALPALPLVDKFRGRDPAQWTVRIFLAKSNPRPTGPWWQLSSFWQIVSPAALKHFWKRGVHPVSACVRHFFAHYLPSWTGSGEKYDTTVLPHKNALLTALDAYQEVLRSTFSSWPQLFFKYILHFPLTDIGRGSDRRRPSRKKKDRWIYGIAL